ncbi:Cof-type HAD-IIB family hydrolase [Siminovitchia sp. FSL H7-0308]|uniref:Cof subfamily protein (Haloacid dehalogenase superfamily) n=1 Tax=Siminovitchia thermophila TaxID=1245522 RepID=A0ABS2RAS0_9BACI|nr:Cof-type HAD-IIB family hydrolase [Siminovitchia thermophila]MBM7716748.1 Cof subfamily protein (haloacid dehalogenase superfamily) [Siminovitchia thermophila]ONK23723.1 hydrolase Cof [Bacillus sp. VT-16-64]
MTKIVFFDIDDTLLDAQKELPASAKAAVRQLQKQGIYTAIATGRAPFFISPVLAELNIHSYICFNGQYVVFENEAIYKNPINRYALQQIDETARERDYPLVYMNEITMKANVPHNELIEKSLRSLKLSHPEFDPHFYKNKEIYQALIFANENAGRDLPEVDDVTYIRWHESSLDIVPKGGSKAEGIKQMIGRLGFQMEDVVAFGDGMNDIEMLQEAGTGVAMGNAHQVVKDHADFVTTNVENDGIVNGLKEIGLLSREFDTVKQ